jgi:hypothetical protein
MLANGHTSCNNPPMIRRRVVPNTKVGIALIRYGRKIAIRRQKWRIESMDGF